MSLTLMGVAAVIVGTSGILVLPRRMPAVVSTALHLIGSALALWAIVDAFFHPTAVRCEWPIPGGALHFVLDPLSAFFLVPVVVVAALGALYGEGYWSDAQYASARRLRCFYGLLTAGLILVMIAGDAWSFLAGWEIVGLAAFFLVITDGQPEALRAGWIYLVAAHTATLVLFAMFALLRSMTGSWVLGPVAHAGSPIVTAILILALVGFGIKAGVMPVHVWLPGAHAAAPSHVSAILSGVVLKMGIYGLVRVITLVSDPPGWFGITVMVLGIVSGVLGVVFALAQHDLKRLLAYHSIENIGIILMGLGMGVVASGAGHPRLAILGYAGGLLHVWNHAAFKALLFYAAGAVVHSTGTRNIERLGGLMGSMRITAIAFAIGAIAICGLPPLNGFVSEWLLYIASFRAINEGSSTTFLAISAPILALIGALALACFVKAFAAVFLGTPRMATPHAHDATTSMRIAMLSLATVCVAIGVWPAGPSAVLARATEALVAEPQTALKAALLPLTMTGPVLIVVMLAIVLATRAALVPKRRVLTWDCGYAKPGPRMQYTSSSFADLFGRMFARVLLPIAHRPALRTTFPAEDHFESHVPDPVLDRLLLPGLSGSHRFMSVGRIIQTGRVQTYLVYIAATLILLLTWSAM